MEHVITFTPSQLWTLLIALAGGVVALSGAVTVVGKAWARIKKPNTDQDKRLDEHQAWLERHEERLKLFDSYFDRDKKRLDMIEEGNRVTQKAILALLAHAIDGNNIKPLQDAKDNLQQYLINR